MSKELFIASFFRFFSLLLPSVVVLLLKKTVSVKGGGRQLCSGLLQKPYANLFKSQRHTEN